MINKYINTLENEINDLKSRIVLHKYDDNAFINNYKIDTKLGSLETTLNLLNKHYNFIGETVYKYVNNIIFTNDKNNCNILNKLHDETYYMDENLFFDFQYNLIKIRIEYIVKELTELRLNTYSTNPFSNLKKNFENEAKQELIEYYRELETQMNSEYEQ